MVSRNLANETTKVKVSKGLISGAFTLPAENQKPDFAGSADWDSGRLQGSSRYNKW